MKTIPTSTRCPVCAGQLTPAVMACPQCSIRIEAPFALNEFAALNDEDLHFLRIFLLAEGRIRDMESALGVSYPTIKTRIAALKSALFGAASLTAGENDPPAAATLTTDTNTNTNPNASGAAVSGAAAPASQSSPPPARPLPIQPDPLAILQALENGQLTFDQAKQSLTNPPSNPPSTPPSSNAPSNPSSSAPSTANSSAPPPSPSPGVKP